MAIFRSRIADELARNREESTRNRQAWEQQAQLNREAVRRNELVLGNLVTITNELREESRTHTQAVFRMLDMLDERLPPPSPS